MSNALILAIIGAVGLPAIAAVVMLLYVRRNGGGERFEGITPGLIPTDVSTAEIGRGSGGRVIPVQFNPPPASAALVGTLLTERARPREISATVVDLAGRGFLTMRQQPATDGGATDWIFTRTDPAVPSALDDYEQTILDGLFEQGSPAVMSTLKGQFGHASARAMGELERGMLTRGWFSQAPEQVRAGSRGLSGILVAAGFAVLFFFSGAGPAGIGVAIGLLGSAAIVAAGSRRIGARTATGNAIAVQALGFRKYLETAEAGQIRFEEAAGIFTRYLPYAIVFDLADHWAKVFGDVAKAAQLQGYDVDTPGWYVADDLSFLTFTMLAFSMDDFMAADMFDGSDTGDFGSGDFGDGGGDGGGFGDGGGGDGGGFGDGGGGDGGGGWFGGGGDSGGGWFGGGGDGGGGGFGDFGGFGD